MLDEAIGANCLIKNVTENKKFLIRCLITNVTEAYKGTCYGEAIDGALSRTPVKAV